MTLPPLFFFFALAIIGCSSVPSPSVRLQQAGALAILKGWSTFTLDTPTFKLRSFYPDTLIPQESLSIYIEGDGLAWVSRNQVSRDPSPINPIGLKLALAQPVGAAAYLARPCQFQPESDKSICEQRYWTNDRFGPLIIDSMNQAVDQLKQRFGARRLILIGYSGGGTVAALLAARRRDVDRLITVAGNLDVTRWSEAQGLSPLEGSLNPSDEVPRLSRTPQVHFVGGKDTVVPPSITQAFANKVHGKVIEEKDFDHACCWSEAWSQLYREALTD